MPYQKNGLATGNILTKAHLDNMENGIAAAAITPTTGTASPATFFRGDGEWAPVPTATTAANVVYGTNVDATDLPDGTFVVEFPPGTTI